MRKWRIRKQLIVLALLPVFLVAFCLVSYFTYLQIQSITQSLEWQGRTVAQQIVPLAKNALATNNINEFLPIPDQLLSNGNIISIRVVNAKKETLAYLNDLHTDEKNPHLLDRCLPDKYLKFREYVPSKENNFQIFDVREKPPGSGNNELQETIGYVEVTLTSRNSNIKKIESLGKSTILILIILLINTILALRISKRIARPVQALKDTVKKIAAGNYKTRVQQREHGELGELSSSIDIMANKIQVAHDDMEARINEYTFELQETMEELEIRNAELDITRSNAMQANYAKSEFLAHMSHEIRTPLGGIIGFSELLENTNLTRQQLDYAKTIHKSANNLLNTIDGVLDLSKIESGKLDITHTEFDILDITEDVIDLLAPIAYEKNVELIYNLDKNAPRLIKSDPIRIRQILTNLIGNAIKFTDEGHVHLYIEHDEITHPGTKIKFIISDTGIGMDNSHKKTIFDAFSQANNSITKRFGGTGLGLTISKNLTRLMNGTIGFDSTYNEGSTFWFTIPVERLDKEPENIGTRLQDMHIALIDNHQLYRKSVISILESWGCKVAVHDRNLTDAPNDQVYNIDAQIVNIYRSSLNNKESKRLLSLNKDIPSLAIVSTRSYKDLKNIQHYGFNNAVFRSEKNSNIKDALINIIEKNETSEIPEPEYISTTNKQDWTNINVMAVDDNSINLKLVKILLKKNGANVVTVSSGEKSIEYIKKRNFDLIFMDIHMPGLDGYETTRQIRSQCKGKQPVILALTANAIANEKTRAAECGMNDLIIKPISEQLIHDAIKKWLHNDYKHELGARSVKVTNPLETFSKSEAMELAAGDGKLANELTSMLIEELPGFRKEIEKALSINSKVQLKDKTHKLHGASRCCGTPALRHAAGQLEKTIDNDITDQLEENVNLLIYEIDRLIKSDPKDISL